MDLIKIILKKWISSGSYLMVHLYKIQKAKVIHAAKIRIVVKPHREGEDRNMDEGKF